MPFLRSKFPKFHDFASATLDRIYAPEKLAAARQFVATTLESGIFWNETEPASAGAAGPTTRFRFQPLPRLAQIAPSFGVVAIDVDLRWASRPRSRAELPWSAARNRAHGWRTQPAFLRGDGRRGFTPVWPSESGFGLAADARGLTTANLNGDGRAEVIAARQ